MTEITRRNFLKLSGKLAVVMGLSSTAIPKIAEALEQLSSGQAPVLWLQGQSCSGCSVSLLNSDQPDPVELLTSYISLRFHSNLSTATGDVAMGVLNDSIDQGGYYLAVEGSIPAGMPEACIVGNEMITKQVSRAARNAAAVVAVGTCAAFGGIPAAENNPTGAMSVPDFLKKEGISTPVISVPGCPSHPDWLVGTLVHVLKFGIPELDASGRPKMFFGELVHDQCQRFADYERERFAKTFSDEGCFFKLGCLGPNTHADCTNRLWNAGTNYCIKAGSPCIGCTSSEFAKKTSFPFFRKNEEES
jgi:hydrogenase small subunit